jgi:beta-ureidopropionase / N-carbamoyl-L-amino-acid hydrolase
MIVPADCVDTQRLWDRHMAMARIGATAAGGVNRQALSAEDGEAQQLLAQWGAAIGLDAAHDAAGNLFLRWAGRDAAAAPVLSGSHLDSQPTGGRFDGVYGVLAALEAVQALREAGFVPARPIEIVAWMNEEGSRFAPGMMGSEAFAGERSLADIGAARDAGGVSVAQALAQMPRFGERALGGPVHAYLEAHIEQGPVLERVGVPLGVVTGIQGKRTYAVTVSGEAAHAGTTERADRRDALLAACALVGALDAAIVARAPEAMFTVGRFNVTPNAPSVIAAQVQFSIDLRHRDTATLAALAQLLREVCAAAGAPCTVALRELMAADPIEFDAGLRALIAGSAQALGVPAIDIYSAAGHDARPLSHVCPAGMIFVPCKGGISHNEAESAQPEHLAAGARVLAMCLARLAG